MKFQSGSLLSVFTFFLVIFYSCQFNGDSKKETTSDPSIFKEILLDYSEGEITVSDPVKLIFRKNIIEETNVGEGIDKNIFQVEPPLSGNVFWESPTTVVFQADHMDFGTKYHFKVDIKKLAGDEFKNVPDQPLDFAIETRPLDYEVLYFPLELKEVSNGETAVFCSGMISFNHAIDSSKIEAMLKTDFSGSRPEIKWRHESNSHYFTIGALNRKEDDQSFQINWDMDEMNMTSTDEKRIIIPSINDFRVLDVEVNPQNERELLISFSDFPDHNQDFNGLVYLDKIDQQPEFYVKGNLLRVIYKSRLEGENMLVVEKTVQAKTKKKLQKKYNKTLYFSSPKPALKSISAGTICADDQEVVFPFEAINLNAVDVEISKVYQNNMMQFLQYNSLEDTYISNEVSEIIWQGKVELSSLNNTALKSKWKRYGLNLMEFIRIEKGALYNVKIGFRKSYTSYPCQQGNDQAFEEAGLSELSNTLNNRFETIWKGWYHYKNRNWSDRNDPCLPMYYTYDNFIQQNIFASNFGILAKYDGSDKLFVSVIDLKSGNPRSSVKIGVYSYQQQLLEECITDENGFCNMQIGHKAYFIIAEENDEFGYLKLNEYQPLSMSEFDIEGKSGNNAIDGFIYGERGVWRPGDTLHLTFVLRDNENILPDDHPLSFELTDPIGKSYYKETTAKHSGPFYSFICPTDSKVLTGNWRAKVKIGPHEFSKSIKIETIKPNRLKIELLLPEKEIRLGDSQIPIQVSWLTGLPGSELQAEIDVKLSAKKTRFKKYDDFVFDDIARAFESRELTLFKEKMDEQGKGKVKLTLSKDFLFPGKMNILFKTRAYEKSGEFSTNSFSSTLSPYKSYVGVNVPKTKWGNTALKTDKDYKIPIVSLDSDGNKLGGRKLSVGIYETKWRWWWDDSGNELAQFNNDKHLKAFKKVSLVSDENGQTFLPLNIEDDGSYMIRVCDEISGHCTGEMFYAGYYGGGEEGKDFASKLYFVSDKSEYNIGDKVKLTLPVGAGSKVLITLEQGGKVIHNEWVTSENEMLDYEFKTNGEMFPNVYVHATVVQGLENKISDLPLRQYGVLNINVKDANKILKPQVKVSDVIKPNSDFSLEVEEMNDQEMFYTLAVVDEGLLDLTHYKTPVLYDHFYARQALLTKNWDNFDQVITGKINMLDRIISIGGDESVEIQNDSDQANRFVPVVRFLGPFHLKKGAKAKYEVNMPNYNGAVRVMLVAANKEAYGSFEKSVKVKEDLMALLTAPRVLSPGESIELPVTVFVTNDKLKEVEVVVDDHSNFELLEDRSKLLQFSGPGEKVVYFKFKAKETEGIGKISVKAKSNKTIASQDLEIDIINPNVYQKKTQTFVLGPGEQKQFQIPLIGVEGSNNAWVEFSKMPSLELEDKIAYLIRYPYGCVEQTTSSVFPQLYLDNLMELSTDRKNRIKLNIVNGIDRLKSFQLGSGGMSYWPGNSDESDWGSVYAAHFLLEAKLKGHSTGSILPGLIKYLKTQSKSYRYSNSSGNQMQSISQAYRSMVLAKAGKPEFSAMNYLYKLDDLHYLSKWYLSLAYSYAGKKDIARQLLMGSNDISAYPSSAWTYGSYLRDYAVLLQAYDKAGMKTKSAALLKKMIEIYKGDSWWNTQTLSWVFMSLGSRSQDNSKDMSFSVDYARGENSLDIKKAVYSLELSESEMRDKPFAFSNTGDSELFCSFVSQGKPLMGDEGEDGNKNLILDIKYVDEEGKAINVDQLKMGTQFKAIVRINKSGLSRNVDEMALSQIFPSGWEILNWRMDGSGSNNNMLDYQDIRDDRVYSFFDLKKREIKIEIPLHASYPGNYYLPQLVAEAMYDDEIYASKAGRWVKVIR